MRGRAAAGAWARDVGAALGQLLLCPRPLSGLLVLAGTAAASPAAALASLAAAALGTVVARAIGYPSAAVTAGLYGYAAALAGLYWPLLFAATPVTWLALAGAALAAPPLTRLTHRLLTPRGVPALALPALVLVWAASLVLPAAGPVPEPGPGVLALAWTLLGAALLVHSRLAALAAALGAAIALLTALALPTGAGPLLVVNGALTGLALGAVLLPWSSGAALVATLGSAATTVATWLWAGPLPVLVAPFTLVTLALLLALRVPGLRRVVPGRPAPLPLASVGSPEVARESWRRWRLLEALVEASPRLCVLTGAGVSTAAGLPDYRGDFGLWAGRDAITLDGFAADAATRDRYWRDEERFWTLVENARPGPVHLALARLHRAGRLTTVVTQNVDGLHQAAGLPPGVVIELHGSVREAVCLDCGERVPRAALSPGIAAGRTALYCERCQGLLKGGSLLFGEPLDPSHLEAALRAILGADLLLVLGTSLAVAPASDLLRWGHEAGLPIAIVNATPTPLDHLASVVVTADVSAVLENLAPTLDRRAPRRSALAAR